MTARKLRLKILDIAQIVAGLILVFVPPLLGKEDVLWSIVGIVCLLWGIGDLRKWFSR